MLEQLLWALFGLPIEKVDHDLEIKPREVQVSRNRDFVGFAEKKINNSAEFKCFDELMHRESSWRNRKNPELIKNKNSSAYGIPQALPGNKMSSHGDDWATNPITQIRWAIDYIEERYKTPCNALRFHDENGYY